MTREQIIADINSEIVEEYEVAPEVITDDAVIYDTLELDSISLVDLISIVQVKFGILISKNDITSIRTFKDLYDYIETHIDKK